MSQELRVCEHLCPVCVRERAARLESYGFRLLPDDPLTQDGAHWTHPLPADSRCTIPPEAPCFEHRNRQAQP